MNIKELADKYRPQLPTNVDDLTFLKDLYIKLGQDKVFDEKYYFGNSGTKKQMYKLAEANKYIKHDGMEKRRIICYSLSYQIKHLLEEFGYKCDVTSAYEIGDHVYPIVTLNDGRKIKFDLQQDLENIQTHCKTHFFATKDDADFVKLYTLKETEQLEIDRAIGYVQSEEDYRDESIEYLKEIIQNNPDLTIWDKLKLILTDSKLSDISKDTGYVESFRYYVKRLLPQYFTLKQLNAKIHTINCFKKTPDTNEKKYTNCIYVDDKSAPKSVYMFSRAHNKYILVPYEKFLSLQKDGLTIDTSYVKGVKKFKNALKKYENSLEIDK